MTKSHLDGLNVGLEVSQQMGLSSQMISKCRPSTWPLSSPHTSMGESRFALRGAFPRNVIYFSLLLGH